jgi:uncharacterized SAM-binding protein YcdF (DUF218 family)
MFLMKKILTLLFFPLSLGLELLLLGLVLLWFTRKQKTGKVVLSIGFLLLLTLSYNAVSDQLLQPLEYRYPPVLKSDDISGAGWVVVLGGGHISDPRLPVTSRLYGTTITRLVEGIRLHDMLPGSKLVLSGGGAFDPVSDAAAMAELAVAIGVDKRDMVLESASWDTKDQARLIKSIVGKDRFVLVTSAFHMPRSMALFQKQGMNPIPAPTGHWVEQRQKLSPMMFFPRVSALGKAELAFHEYLGMVWARIRGQI